MKQGSSCISFSVGDPAEPATLGVVVAITAEVVGLPTEGDAIGQVGVLLVARARLLARQQGRKFSDAELDLSLAFREGWRVTVTSSRTGREIGDPVQFFAALGGKLSECRWGFWAQTQRARAAVLPEPAGELVPAGA